MTTLAAALRGVPSKIEVESHAQFVEVADLALASVQVGSVITGSPGQPVDTGRLRASWGLEFLARWRARIGTNVEYAPFVEDGIGRYGPVVYGAKNGIGGSHSGKITILGLPKIVIFVRARRSGHRV